MKLYGLIGYPLSHSFSKTYFTQKFQEAGLSDHRYENFPLEHISEFKKLLNDHPELCGLNVTIPYKETVIPFLDELDPEAAAIGAVNCIRMNNGRTVGYNTDVFGFAASIRPFLENKYERALILGTGGASKAVAAALKKWNMPFFFVSRAHQDHTTIRYQDLSPESIRHFGLIVNTTPRGMFPHIEDCPEIPYNGLGPGHFLYDLIYNPEETLFLRKGKAAGAATMNGLKMLQLQAERGWEIWNAKV